MDEDLSMIFDNEEPAVLQATQLPEAPFSVNFRVTGTNNLDYQFTTRSMTATGLFKNIAELNKIVGKQAQTTGIKKAEQVDPETCQHLTTTVRESSGHNKPENKGKRYTVCLDCNKWIGWV